MKLGQTLAKTNDILTVYLKLTYPLIMPIAILALIAFPTFFILLSKTEILWLDITCTIADLGLLINRLNGFLHSNFLYIYWFCFIILCFPFNFTYNLFVNSHNIGYELGEIIMLMAIFTMIPSTLLTFIVLFLGISIATIVFFISQASISLPTDLNHTFPWYLLAMILGFIFSAQRNQNYQKEKLQTQQLAIMKNQLAHLDRNDSIKEAILAVAHELNQPLSAISNYINGSMRYLNHEYNDKVPSKLEHAMRQTQAQAQRAADIVLALKNFLCHQPTKTKIVEINKLIKHVIELMQPTILKADIKLGLNLSTALPKIKCNQTQIELVLTNLINNAIEAINTGHCETKRIIITTRKHLNQQISITIEDTGPGIDDEIKEKLFFPFVTSKEQGVGLGLSLSYNIIQRLGGHISADSVKQKGSRFTIILPTT